MSGDSLRFEPFYEWPANKFPGFLIGRVVVAVLLGGAFMAAHWCAVGEKMFGDWSWFVGPLIVLAMLALYYATDTLRGLLPGMSLRLCSPEHYGAEGAERHANDAVFMKPLRTTLSNGKFLLAGVAIGLLNCWMGHRFGLPKTDGAGSPAALLFGFFLAGFICGMAAWGIYGVTVTIAAFAKHAKSGGLDYRAPDHCGGVQFIGEGLVAFSSVTLIVGVAISIFIHEFAWDANEMGVKVLQWIWIVLPYLLSLVVLVAPAVPLNDALREYQRSEDEMRLKDIHETKRKFAEASAPDRQKELRKVLTRLRDARQQLYEMGTWPHGVSANLKYLAIFLVNFLASASTAFSLFDRLGK